MTSELVFDEQHGEDLAGNLTSGEEARVRLAMVTPEGVTFEPGFVDQLAALEIEIDPGSFEEVSPGSTASVTATVTGASDAPQHWLLHLVAVDGAWLISDTSRQDES